ncbi:MAG: hypothetical protein AAGD92_08340 [Pseudomonadota bacterium]
MGVVEKAGAAFDPIAAKEKKKKKKKKPAPDQFTIDFERMEGLGYYHPERLGTPLAMELRAVKRRLLRRLGFLRASGDRQAFRKPGRQRNLVLVTSAQASEGKTFCSANLALSLSFEDQIETVLVDADVPRPKVRERFGLERKAGLTDCLTTPSLDTAFVMSKANGAPLRILTEGAPVDRAADLFSGQACQQLFSDLSTRYRDGIVLIDAPPVLARTEAVVLAKYVDEIAFVVSANETQEPAVAAALDELLDVNPNVSLILNRCLIGAGAASYGSYEYYGRDDDGAAAKKIGWDKNHD